jgi:protein involved in polysaccharide export with SLBB domain
MLNPYDNIFVRRQPGWEVQRNVSVTGEVEFPGMYTLAVKSERLSRLLERAGGLTTEAYPDAIQFFRREGAIGRVAIDLPSVLGNPRHRDNLVLAPGDSIHIPRYIPTVRVLGAVNFPSSVTYVPGEGISYYLDAAGGVNYQGDKGKAFVQQPNGLTRRGGRPLAGAVIMVPEKDPNARGLVALLPFFSAFVSIIATTATLIIAISN